jgi:hypothetical protein
MWTKRHDNFVLSQKKENKSIPPSAQLVWRFYERRRHQLGEEMDIDLEQCNKWIARQKGSGFERKTLKNAISLLESVGVITIVKKYHNWRDYRIILHGIEYICDRHKITPKKNSPKQEKFTTLPGHFQELETSSSNQSIENVDRNGVVSQQQQNTIHLIDELTRSIGVIFDVRALNRLARYGVDRVHKAIKLFELRSLTNKIFNPQGFIVNAARFKWFDRRVSSIEDYVNPEVGIQQEISSWIFDLVRAWFPKRRTENLEIEGAEIKDLEHRLELDYIYGNPPFATQ